MARRNPRAMGQWTSGQVVIGSAMGRYARDRAHGAAGQGGPRVREGQGPGRAKGQGGPRVREGQGPGSRSACVIGGGGSRAPGGGNRGRRMRWGSPSLSPRNFFRRFIFQKPYIPQYLGVLANKKPPVTNDGGIQLMAKPDFCAKEPQSWGGWYQDKVHSKAISPKRARYCGILGEGVPFGHGCVRYYSLRG